MSCCFSGPIHSTRAQDSSVNSDADNWLVTNTSVCSERSPGDREPALSRMRGLFCFAVYRGQAIKLEWKERSLLLAPASPQTPIKPVPHNGGGRGDESSHGEPALHRSMCLFKQEASSLVREGVFLFLVRLEGQLFPDQRHAEQKALASGHERLRLVPDRYRTLRLCLSWEVMETQKRFVSWHWFHFKLGLLKLFPFFHVNIRVPQ